CEELVAMIEQARGEFKVDSGEVGLTLPLLAIGGDGTISLSAHVVGNEMQEMVQAFQQGETKKAAQIHRRLLPVFNALFSAPNPVPVKYQLNQIGVSVGSVRLPLVGLGDTTFIDQTFKVFYEQ